jgi:S1-C subfamily serine protease
VDEELIGTPTPEGTSIDEAPAEPATPAENEWPGPPPVAASNKRRGGLVWWTVVAVLAAALGVAAFFGGRWSGGGSPAATIAASGSVSEVVTPTVGTSSEPVADVAAALAPSVVQLQTDTGLGSGVIYDSNGYIVTAGHVIEGATRVTVRLADGNQMDGTVLGVDAGTDVGVVKIEASGLPAAAMAPDATLRVGQMAIAIGSPWGLDQTVTAGVISSIQRSVPGSDGVVRNMIQTDAPINPGSSGGALADRSGRVIGISDSIFSQSGGNEGVGFAIPIKTAMVVARQLAAGQQVKVAFLGVGGTEPTSGPAGALVTEVVPGSAAEAAGLQVNDLVTSYNGEAVLSFIDLAGDVRSSQPGDTATLTVIRAGQTITVEVVLGQKQA